MADPQQSSNRLSTFGRDFMKFVSQVIPQSSYGVIDKINEVNPKYKLFYDKGTDRQELLQGASIALSTKTTESGSGIIGSKDFSEYIYASLNPDKGKRLIDYRIMGAFAEVADALDEICDESINKDLENRIVTLDISDTKKLAETAASELNEEFNRYINYFELGKKGWEYVRQLLTEGELYFEHIVHRDYPEKGILGIVQVPCELMDPVFGNVQNGLVKAFLLRKPIFDAKNPGKIADFQLIPMEKNQITYISSGIWNENKTMRLPFIENARRAYRQLSLIEDSIVIYRLVRAPERLVFNVDTGNLPAPKAEAYLRKLMDQYWSRKTFDSSEGGTVKQFRPQSMLDSFWFAKRAGSEGTSVTQLAGGANLGELTDLLYFVKKLYKSLRVPTNRLNPEDTYRDGAEILREELKFARFVIRIQEQIAEGLKTGFITHLKLKKMWDKYELKETHINLKFNPPTNFYELREYQRLEVKMNAFGTATNNEAISKTYALKKYLGWNDTEIKANREFLRKDKEFVWELMQIEQSGPNWKNAAVKAAAGGEAAAPGGMGPMPMGGGGGGGGMPPEFGPTGPAGGEVAGAEAGGAPGGAAAGGAPGAAPAPAGGGGGPSALPA